VEDAGRQTVSSLFLTEAASSGDKGFGPYKTVEQVVGNLPDIEMIRASREFTVRAGKNCVTCER